MKKYKQAFMYGLSQIIDPFDWLKIREKQHLDIFMHVITLPCNKHMLKKLIDKQTK